jgi:hypothetical protein
VRLGGRAGVELHAVRLRVSPCTHLSDAVLIANVAPLVREQSRLRAVAAPRSWLLSTNNSRLLETTDVVALRSLRKRAARQMASAPLARSGGDFGSFVQNRGQLVRA